MGRVVPLSPGPERSAGEGITASARLLSFLIVVALPTAVWTTLAYAVGRALTVSLSAVTVIVIAALLSGFLSLIWAVLVVNRPNRD